MFYILVSRIPFIYNISDKKDKLFRTFLIGSVCYIILHGLLYSKKFSDNQFVEKYKKYLLYLVGADLSLALGIVYFLDKKVESDDNSYVESVSDDEDNHTIEENNKLTREQILHQFYRNQMLAQQQAMANNGSPFINKTGAEELKKTQVPEQPTNKDSKDNENKVKIEVKEDNKKPAAKNDTQSSSSKKSEKHNTPEELNLSNGEDMQSKLSDKNKSLEKLLEVISDTELPLYKSPEA